MGAGALDSEAPVGAFASEMAPAPATDPSDATTERLLNSLSELASELAHEIRARLNASRLRLAVLEERVEHRVLDPQDVLSAVAFATREFGRVSTVLEQFVKLPAWHPLTRSTAPLDETLRRAAEVCRAEARARSAGFSVGSAGRLEIWLDHGRIQRAVEDLLRAALNSAGPGGHVRLSARARGGSVLLVIESDGGNPCNADEFFKPVFSARAESGLALFAARQTVLAHGGEIRAASHSGRTLFEVRLPRLTEPR